MTLRLNGSTSGYTEIDAPATAGSNTLTLPTGNGTSGQVLSTNGSGALSWATVVQPAVALTAATAVASTSGTSIDFTGIPSGAKRVTVMLNQVSSNGGSAFLIQLGTSSGVETSSYVGQLYSEYPIGGSSALSSGFLLTNGTYHASASTYSAKYVIQNINSNNWISSGFCVENGGSNYCYWTTGSKSLAATLDRIRITTAGGANTFDAGTINIMYEG